MSKQIINRPQAPRWSGWDYSNPGAYFVTLCARDRACLFGEISDGEVRLNRAGEIVQEEWLRSPDVRKEIMLDAFVVMPNHLHGIVAIVEPVNESHCRARLQDAKRLPRSVLGSFIAGFKACTTKRINEVWRGSGRTVWQPSYYDHVIRSERAFNDIQHYIAVNALRWTWDEYHPDTILK